MKLIQLVLCGALAVGCGSVVREDGTGGSGATGTGATSSTSSVTTGCSNHDACGNGRLCNFTTGECGDACNYEDCQDDCGDGFICGECVTSACPDCLDCRSMCAPMSDGLCDEGDACAPDFVCDLAQRRCIPSCTNGACADPNMVCNPCVSGSCCGCKDCVEGCTPGD
jgi:hypothetical protein